MIIFPAVDMKDNRCVRLCQGDFQRIKIYSDQPLELALEWERRGAEFLHLVDLDGAKGEGFVNKKSIEEIAKNLNIPVQVGGGIRSEARVEELLNLGVNRVIVGTMAIEDRELLKKLVSEYKEKIVVSIDAKDGKAAARGWTVVSSVDSLDLCKELEEIGVKTIVYTDIAKDGMLEGPNFDVYKALTEETRLDIIASGGISSIEDVRKLKSMDIYGGIIGKAFYDNLLDFGEVMECLQKE
ncbi:1-(5-phosphoribosyl)-5-[(5-phosphoribosylamino)methylideneamino]imidazole-4-carboxamide isomerase [Lutispora sp.]|uniref:1-(5-phosphoribosyl)-5-[(5- phosphoribosylamino)methylideneamino]imidazole-4- carboxamide isomerase n=1 Tax=Lutispora sp. TaxID=2828727 RepID=UPI002B1F0C63|nr:1-(5-phosphoribosyl)-5-[(5-phosphoribosylamino)methylideneamino]imidazole-4-carboxamide isomerase [Lutispora sp.]MEA4960784.1 1-(5-phosphoribosyl)-5-[(5-phosphoribosylamino)methylideneamino]imidazole-4-carboxamide isomerase [Lutispora sp.]